MQRYHLKVEGISEYINILNDAQKQTRRAGQNIADETLLLFARKAILATKRYFLSNDNSEDRAGDKNIEAQSSELSLESTESDRS